MQHGYDDGPAVARSIPTALVVDDSFAARARVAQLLLLGGWRVQQAVGTDDALRLAALIRPELVVTDMVMRRGHGATLMRRLREQGCSARFLVVTARRTQQVRALAAASGALACLGKPVDPRLFVDVLRGLSATLAPPPAAEPNVVAPAVEFGARTIEMYLSALPHWLATIATSAQQGDAAGVAVAAEALASASDRMGQVEIAFLASAVAHDARRGAVTHTRLVKLVELCARIDQDSRQAATSR
jgi:CheY-like chemotaxis protein